MIKIWAKVMKKEKIIKDYMYVSNSKELKEDLFISLMNICKELDIETPIILSKHIRHLEEFNNTKFIDDDFVDTINFDFLVLENIKQ